MRCPYHVVLDLNLRRLGTPECHDKAGFFFTDNTEDQMSLEGIAATLTAIDDATPLNEPPWPA